MKENSTKVDTQEFEIPQTTFSRDIENRVIQVIVLQCIEKVKGVRLLEGKLIDSLFGREGERVKGITVEQDSKNHLVNVKVEVNLDYGISIPEKSEELQSCVVKEITDLTGLHVASVHVVVKGLVPEKMKKEEEEMYPTSFLVKEELEEDLEERV